MKNYLFNLIVLLLVLIVCINLHAVGENYITDSLVTDTLKSKEIKKMERELEKIKLRNSNQRFAIKFGYVYAALDTEISFELPTGNLSTTLSLEQNLGLPDNSFFLTGSFVYRITPQSGIYSQYYGINRVTNSQTDQELIFKDETIPAGTNVKTHFNTQVLSTGYLYSVLRDNDAFLGFYANIYLMILDTGVKSEYGEIDSDVKLIAPLPNLGLIAAFKLNNWLNLNGGAGFFSLNTSDFGGSLYNFDISLMAKPASWLGVSLSYQQFDVRVYFPSDNISTVVDYNFRGPALGLSFIF